MTKTTVIEAPNPTLFERRRGARRADPVYLRPAAARALGLYMRLVEDRAGCDEPADTAGTRTRVAAAKAEGPTLAALVTLAESLAAQADPDRNIPAQEHAAAAKLRDEHDRLDPPPAWTGHGQDDETDRCRHGRTFAETCTDCEV